MKLSKKQVARQQEVSNKISEAAMAVEEAANKFEDKADLKPALLDTIAAYNAVIEEAQEFASEIAEEILIYHSEKSERWQESDRGYAVETMATTWQEWAGHPATIDVSELDDEALAALAPDGDLPQDMDELPTRPED